MSFEWGPSDSHELKILKAKECLWKIKNELNTLEWSIHWRQANKPRVNIHDPDGALANLIQHHSIEQSEIRYLANHETMGEEEYNQLFAWKDQLQQWQLGDCYLVSWINQLSHAQHFDTLMRTSLKRVKRVDWSKWYQVQIPLWEPSWRKILIKDLELGVAMIKWKPWFKLLELAYAKNKLRKNDAYWNRYRPITKEELKKINWWRTHEVLQTFLGKQNIWFSDYWTLAKNFRKGKPLNQLPQAKKYDILNYLKKYDSSIWNKFISLASLPWWSDQHSYTVWWKTIYYRHAYSISWIKKDSQWNK